MKPSVLSLIILVALGLLNGCKDAEDPIIRATNTYAVVIGMEQSRYAGACTGSKYDSSRMFALLSKYTSNITLLQDDKATKASVVKAIKDAIAGADYGLAIIYYSGHGGSDPFPDTKLEDEVDGKDEYLCLYDTFLRDNEIWQMISQSHGRVFWITDSCHSQTQFRNPVFRINPPLSFDHTLIEKQNFSMLCWSGCPDNTYSYGTSSGGGFTHPLLRHF